MEKNEKTKQINNLETPKSGHRHKKTGKENCYLEISKSEKPQDLEIFQYFFLFHEIFSKSRGFKKKRNICDQDTYKKHTYKISQQYLCFSLCNGQKKQVKVMTSHF